MRQSFHNYLFKRKVSKKDNKINTQVIKSTNKLGKHKGKVEGKDKSIIQSRNTHGTALFP